MFTVFTTIVFIAELIIAFTIIFHLIKLDKSFISASAFLEEAKPKIKDISLLARGISEQMAQLTPIWVDNFRKARNKIILDRLESLMSAAFFWFINIKMMKKLKKARFIKATMKGLSLIQNVL